MTSERSGWEDPLSYLPCSAITEFRKGQLIYDVDQAIKDLYLVIEGAVKISRTSGQSEIIIDFRQTDEFFGEASLIRGNGERAVALERTKAMSWPAEAVRDLIVRHPKLGVALVQLLVNRSQEMGERIATQSADSTARRLAKALLDFGGRLGQADPETQNAQRLPPLSHKLLAQYIGTRREAVTHCMNQFRRDGLVSYSRRGLIVYVPAVQGWLKGAAPAEEPTQMQQPPAPESAPPRWNGTVSV